MGSAQAKHEKEAVWEERTRFMCMSPDTKRRHYFCGSGFVKADDIPDWATTYTHSPQIHHSDNSSSPRYPVVEKLNHKVALWKGDISRLELGAIVCSACDGKQRPDKVFRTVCENAGDYYYDECVYKGVPTEGLAKVIGGYRLPAKYVINVRPPSNKNQNRLGVCYTNSLEAAIGHGIKTVAFPCIGTNKWRAFSKNQAARIALDAVRRWLQDNFEKVDKIVFCVFDDDNKSVYEDLLQVYFPVVTSQDTDTDSDDDDDATSPNGAVRLERLLFVHHLLSELGHIHMEDTTNDEQDPVAGSSSQGTSPENQQAEDTKESPLAQWQQDTRLPFQVQMIEVDRNTDLKQLKAIYDNPTINLHKRPFIRYTEEDGMDLGALTRDFFYKGLEYLSQSQVGAAPAFEGQTGHRLPCASRVHSQGGVFELTGNILAHSVLHGGVGIIGLSPAIVFLLSHPVTKQNVDVSGIPLCLEDLTDVDILELFRKAENLTSLPEGEKRQIQEDFRNVMIMCNYGYTPITSENLQAIKQEILLYEVVYKRWDQIEQLRHGMDILGLYSFLRQNPTQSNLSKVSPREEDLDITPEIIKTKMVSSDQDSATFGYFTHLLYDLHQGNIANLSLADLVAFWTGAPMLTNDKLVVSVADDHQLPVAHCCFSQLVLHGTTNSYDMFRDKFVYALTESGEGFHAD